MISRKSFINAKFPLLAYENGEYSKSSSTRFSESRHILNKASGIQLNFWWRCDDKVSVSKSDRNDINPRKNNVMLIECAEKGLKGIIVDLFDKYLY